MAVEIVMPRLSDSMEEGTILQWLVAVGDRVQEGAPLVEVETDKATVTYESEHDGTVLALHAEAGTSVAVGAPIAVIGADGQQPARVKASPLARRLAVELGVDLAMLTGSGPQGRVTREDVLAAAPAAAAPAAAAPAPDDTEPAQVEPGTVALTRLQQTVARRMSQSRATVPEFELRSTVDMTRAVALHEQLRGLLDPPPSQNDLVVRAAALALREFPRVNGSYRDDRIELHSRVNVGIAVAAEDALVVPTIFDAD